MDIALVWHIEETTMERNGIFTHSQTNGNLVLIFTDIIFIKDGFASLYISVARLTVKRHIR